MNRYFNFSSVTNYSLSSLYTPPSSQWQFGARKMDCKENCCPVTIIEMHGHSPAFGERLCPLGVVYWGESNSIGAVGSGFFQSMASVRQRNYWLIPEILLAGAMLVYFCYGRQQQSCVTSILRMN